MTNILDLAMEQQMNNQANDQVVSTEKSQIVVSYNVAVPALVLRFNSVKKGKKEYIKLVEAWALYKAKNSDPYLHDVDGDMFISTIDLWAMATVSFVDHAKRAKFIPV
jgi:hypothetical protein